MKHIHRASLGLILVLVLGAFSLPALAESSTHALTWVSGKNSTVSTDKLTMEAKPTANYETEHIMEMNFSFTGLADKYKAEIRIPAHIFYDRSGSAVGTYMVPLPQYNPSDPESSEPPNAATKFNWRLDSETDEIVISNYAPVEDNFFLTLQVKYFVTPHLVKEGYTKDFSSTMQVQTRSGEVETYTSNDLTMIYRTKADLSSLTKNTSDAVTYKDWQSSWGPVPDGINAADYFFVRWRLYGNASTNDTQPFSISFKETNPPSAEYGTMFAYSSAFSGGVKKATLEEFNQLNNPFTTVDKPRTSSTTNATTFDIYTYFMYPRSPLDADLKATVKNQAEIELFGVDGAYDIRKASGVKEFLGKPPAPTSPGNKVSAIYKNNSGTTYGGINKLESNQQNGLPVRLTSTNTPGRGHFYFSGEVTGWDMTKEGDAYGVRPFTADLTDHELSIYNPITKKQQRLVEGEYQFTKLYFTGFTVYDPVVTETSMSTVGRANALYKPLLLQVEQGGQWKDYANIQKQTNGSYVFTPVTDGPAVPPGLNLNIPLPAGTTGVRYLYTDNAVLVRFSSYSYLETEIFPTPGILEIIDGQENASVTNTMSLRGLDDQNVERAPRRTTSATHYPYRTTSKNYFSKSFAPAVNNVNTSRFYFPITLTAYSMVTSPDLTLEEVKAGNHVIEQKVSTFYDLLPPGTYADLGSIRVTGYGDAMKNTVFPHTVEVHDNWKSSGRALLVVHAQAPEGVSNFHHFVSGTYSSLTCPPIRVPDPELVEI